MVFSSRFGEVIFDVFKPVCFFRPAVKASKPMLPAQPGVESGGAPDETEQRDDKERQLRNDGKQKPNDGQQ